MSSVQTLGVMKVTGMTDKFVEYYQNNPGVFFAVIAVVVVIVLGVVLFIHFRE